MDLKEYRTMIKNQLLSDVKKQSNKEASIASGEYQAKHTILRAGVNRLNKQQIIEKIHILEGDYAELLRKMNELSVSKVNMQPYADAGAYKGNISENVKPIRNSRLNMQRKPINQPQSSESDNSDYENDELVGGKINFKKTMKKTGKELGQAVKKEAINQVAKEGVAFVKRNAVTAAKYAATEAIPMAEEAAPMLLMAAGMKKTQSQKQLNRATLIRKLMKKESMTMVEASSYIKNHDLKFWVKEH